VEPQNVIKHWVLAAALLFLVVVGVLVGVRAQGQYGWCGYALVDGLPLLENQLAVFEAITPPKSSRVNPSNLFQYRFSLDHRKVLIEGCFGVPPTRDVVAALLANVIPASQTLIDQVSKEQALLAPPAQAAMDGIDLQPSLTPTTISGRDAVRLYIDATLTLTIFAPGGTDAESAAAAVKYLQEDAAEWERPDE
jgi:hypothetical protein